jgi:hypothetical protein
METWFQVKFMAGEKGPFASRLINQEERDIFVKSLAELNCQYLGEDTLIAEPASVVLAKLKKELLPANSNEGAKIIDLKVVK